MADQTLGSLDVVISADWSDLESAINDAVSAAQDGAQAIQDAFDQGDTFDTMAESIGTLSDALSDVEGAAGEAGGSVEEAGSQMELFGDSTSEAATQVTALDDSANGIAESMIEIGDAASESASQVDELAAASEEAGSSGQAAASGLSSMREMLLELGEGLAVAEGIKDFSASVVSAYASVQTATVALTAMTGSAEGAAASIEELEQMSLQIPVATESLIAATREMTAFGLSAEQTSALVMDAANASAASGFAFDEVTSALSRLVLSGQAGARQLATLGISTQTMAAAMTQFGVAATATSAEVSKAFGALNVEQRIDVIDTALARFGGLAALQAQTVAGQWQILENQWDLTAEKIGETLAPLAQGLMSFASSVVSGISEAVDAFRELPGPIQDVGLAAVAVLGAAGPILAGLAAVGLAVEGLQGIPGTLARIAGALGLTGDAAVVATPEVAAFAGAETAAGGAGATAAPKVTAFAGAETAAGEAAVGAEVGELTTGIKAAGGAAVTATGAVGALSGVLTGLGYVAAGVAAAWGTWHLLEWATGDALAGQGALVVLSDDLKQVSTWAENVGISWDKGVASLSTSAIDTANTSINSLGSALQKLVDLIPGAKQFTDQVQSGMQALNVAGFNAVTSIDASSKSTQNFVGWLNSTGVATSAAGEAVNSLEVKMDGLRSSLASAQATLSEEKASQDGTAVSAQNLAAAQQAVITAQKALDSAMGESTKNLGTYRAAMNDLSNATVPTLATQVEAAAQKIVLAQSKIDGELQVDIGVWEKFASGGTASATQIDAAWQKIQKDFSSGAQGADEAELSVNDLATAFNDAAGGTGAFDAVVVNGQLKLVQMDQSATGLKSTIGLLIDAVQAGELPFKQAAGYIQSMVTQANAAGIAMGSAANGVTILKGAALGAAPPTQQLGVIISQVTTAAGQQKTVVTDGAAALAAIAGKYAVAGSEAQSFGGSVGSATTATQTSSIATIGTTDSVDAYGKALTTTVENVVSLNQAQTQAVPQTQAVANTMQFTSTSVDAYGKALTTTTAYTGQFTEFAQDAIQVGDKTSLTYGTLTETSDTASQATATFSDSTGQLVSVFGEASVSADTSSDSNNNWADSAAASGTAASDAAPSVDAIGEAYATAGDDAATAAQQVDLFNDAVSGSVGAATSVQGDTSGGKKGYGVPLPPAGQGLTGLTESYDPAVTGDIVQSYVAAVGNAITAAWNTKQTAAVQQQIQQLEAVASGQAWFPGSSGPNAKDEQQAEQALQQMGISFSGVATSANSTSTATTAAATSLSALLGALEATTTSSNNLSNSLTGHSLAPDLDTTTVAVDQMTAGLTPLRGAIAGSTQAASDLQTAQNTLSVTTNFLADTSLSASETTADLQSSLGAIQSQIAGAGSEADQYAQQLAALQDSGDGASGAAQVLAAQLQQENNASTDLQESAGEVYDQLQSQIAATSELAGVSQDATAAIGTDSSGGLTSAVTSLGVAAGSAAALIGQITSTSAPSGGTQISPSQIDTPQGAWYLSTMNGVTVWTLQSGTAQVPPAPETPTALTGAAAAIGQTSSSSAPQGTQISPTQINNAQGSWFLGANGQWQLQGGTASGGSTTGNQPTATAGDPFSAAQIATLAGGGSVQSGAPLSVSQAAAVAADVAAYLKANPPAYAGSGLTGATNTNYADLPDYAPETYGAFPTSTATPTPASGSGQVTINMSGITPGNAQQLSTIMTNQLRLSGFGKLT